MSQVYQSEKDRVEGRGLDPRVSKSCILNSHLWTRIDRVWESRNSFFSLNRPMFDKESTMWSVALSCICLFVSNCHQYLPWYYPTPNSMSFTFYCCWHVTLMRRLTYEILSLSKRGSSDLVAKCRGVLWSKSPKRVSTRHTTWFWESYA